MSTLVRKVRLVPVGLAPSPEPSEVDLRIVASRVTEVSADLPASAADEVFEAGGRWAIPGLWDHHVHLAQWAQTTTRLDVSGTSSPAEVAQIVGDHLSRQAAGPSSTLLVGGGFRSAAWQVQPTVADLDVVSGSHPVVLVSGDGHNGWLNSPALARLGVPPRCTPLDENEWFPVYSRLAELPETRVGLDEAYRQAVQQAAARGVVGVVDMEFAANYLDWPARFAAGIDQLRVRTATYPDRLADVIAAGLRSGDPLPGGAGKLTMGPLKIISDGSLNTRTARCHDPYLNADDLEYPFGKQLYSRDELVTLLARAAAGGLEVAVHAIGDAAVTTATDAFAITECAGTIEHAQLVALADLPRLAALGVRASVQPAHLLDDRDITHRYWPDRAARCFAFRSMISAGVRLALGSDAPVAPLDPWLAMAAAVHRSANSQDPWNEAESLTAAQALAASTDGQTTLAPGSRGDLVLVDDDPLASLEGSAAVAAHLRGMRVAATLVAGRPTYNSL